MAIRDISNIDKTIGLFKNLRLEIFVSPCDISKVALRDTPNEDKVAGLFKDLRFETFASSCDISKVALRYLQ